MVKNKYKNQGLDWSAEDKIRLLKLVTLPDGEIVKPNVSRLNKEFYRNLTLNSWRITINRFKLQAEFVNFKSGAEKKQSARERVKKAVETLKPEVKKVPIEKATPDLVGKWVERIEDLRDDFTEGKAYQVESIKGDYNFVLKGKGLTWHCRYFALCPEESTVKFNYIQHEEGMTNPDMTVTTYCESCHAKDEEILDLQDQVKLAKEPLNELIRIREQYALEQGESLEDFIISVGQETEDKNEEITALKELLELSERHLSEFNRIREQYALEQGESLEDFVNTLAKSECEGASAIEWLKELLASNTETFTQQVYHLKKDKVKLEEDDALSMSRLKGAVGEGHELLERAELAEARLEYTLSRDFRGIVKQLDPEGWMEFRKMVLVLDPRNLEEEDQKDKE